MSIDEFLLDRACTELRVDRLTNDEYAFLREYHGIMSLISGAMQTLESNRYTFGIYLPTLFGLKYKLQNLINAYQSVIDAMNDADGDKKEMKYKCLPLLIAIKRGFDSRFGDLIDSNNVKSMPLYVSMMSNPTFKLNFMACTSINPHLFTHLKNMLSTAAIDAYKEEFNSNPVQNENLIDTGR